MDVNGLLDTFEVRKAPPSVIPKVIPPVQPSLTGPSNWWLIVGITVVGLLAGAIILGVQRVVKIQRSMKGHH